MGPQSKHSSPFPRITGSNTAIAVNSGPPDFHLCTRAADARAICIDHALFFVAHQLLALRQAVPVFVIRPGHGNMIHAA